MTHSTPKAPARIVSGIQPTGHMHLGNYLGAIRNWLPLLDQGHQCFFFVADLHALTLPQDPQALRDNAHFTLALYIACGIDPEKAVLFPQSYVRAHSELMWLLACHTPLGWLNRMTQFKDKAGKHKDSACLGLYAYPVLMAADILLYDAQFVPVGEDQKQHLELARDLAQSINHYFGKPLLMQPEPLILPHASRIMSLREGTQKMSKSDSSEYARIHMNDADDAIALKIRKAKSDPHPFPGSAQEAESRPEAANFAQIMAACIHQSVDHVYQHWAGQSFATVKSELTDALISLIRPIRTELYKLLPDKNHLNGVMMESSAKASTIANATLLRLQSALGLR